MKKISIGGGQGFWGDSNDAAIHMIHEADLNYLACDYLAELTLSIMARQKTKDSRAGYARDFLGLMDVIASEAYKKHVGIITNAGGMNIEGCVSEMKNLAESKGLHGYRIGYVLGDDILRHIPKMEMDGIKFENIDEIGDFSSIKDKLINANVYFGHEPIVGCLQQEANVVITGRATDSALFLSPLIHEFGWKENDWNNLAKGIMAGHLLECGGQGSGGNFDYGWRDVPDMDKLGFPIAQVTDDSLIITKAPNCGGLVSEQSVKEQFVYEIHDPSQYKTPDVIVDISNASLYQVGDNKVEVTDIVGKPRPDQLKLCLGYHAGYKVVTYLCFAWPDAYEKAQYAAAILKKKMKSKGIKYDDIHISYIGLNSLHLGVSDMSEEMTRNINEVVLRLVIRTINKLDAEKLVPEIAPLQLNGPPGASFFGGRSHVQEVIGLWPTLIPRDSIHMESRILEVK